MFQVFQCHEHTTEEELSLFLQRADQHAFLHVLLEINKLSFQMQEVCSTFKDLLVGIDHT